MTRVADRQPPEAKQAAAPHRSVLQRKCACGASHAAGECATCRQERLRGKGGPAVGVLPPSVEDVVSGGGAPLDASTRQTMEARFGHDFTRVRVHADSRAARSARDVGARAYTVGHHVVFGGGEHRPETHDGRQLLAHELTHVAQQSEGDVAPSSEAHLEREADAAAAAVTRNEDVRVSGRADDRVYAQRGHTAAVPPQPTTPTPRQQGVIDAARRAAAIRCQIAMFRTGGIVPAGPAGHIDSAVESRQAARRLAQVMFQWDDPNMEQVSEVISSMVNYLTSGVAVMVAGRNDPECGTRAAYVRGLRPPIVLCPAFFSETPEQQIRTMVHEAAHLARIGTANLGESYCVDFDCQTSCGGFDSADSWSHYVHCLSGRPADQPVVIQGRRPGRGGGGSGSGGGDKR